MKWNLRLAAANRGIWKASELHRMLTDHGMKISAGKMSGLWSGNPASIKLDDLDIICAALGCEITEILIPETDKITAKKTDDQEHGQAATADGTRAITPKSRTGRSLPPR